MSEQIEPSRIPAPIGRSLVSESNSPRNLIREYPDVTRMVLHPGKIRGYKMGARADK
jgi:hypothetical protein